MPASASPATLLRRARAELADRGLLLLADAARPSLVTLVTGEPVRGSWWGHPLGNVIFNLSGALEDTGEVVTAKLVDGKVTYVARALWPALAGVGRGREVWQTEALDAVDKALLKRLDKAGELRTDALAKDDAKRVKAMEARLLFHTEQVHTDGGAHATRAVTWDRFAVDRGLGEGELLAPVDGRAVLEQAVERLGGGKVPWRKGRR